MQYRAIGKTGKKSSIVGLGCEHLDRRPAAQVTETIRAALEGGVNYLDVFMPGREVRENIAAALGPRRKDVYLQGHIGSTDLRRQYDISRDLPTAQKYFEDFLRVFGYADFGMLFFVDSMKDYEAVFNGGIADYARRLKEKGDIAHIGFSAHNPFTAAKVVETGLVDVMLFSVNLAFDLVPAGVDVLEAMDGDRLAGALARFDPDRAALYSLCERKGVGITVMKPLGAGKLLSPQHTPFSRPMTTAQCVHYALSRPGVCSILPGCQSAAEMRELIAALDAPDAEKDYTPFLTEGNRGLAGQCVYCGHCQPCPADIDIAALGRLYDTATVTAGELPAALRARYAALPNKAADCIGCGACEERCPFGVKVIERMQAAARVFG